MTPKQLSAIGEALYGTPFQSNLARDLGYNARTVRRWIAGDKPIPENLTADLLPLVEKRGLKLSALLDKLQEEVGI